MELVTRFSLDDEVFDTVSKEFVTIRGFDLKHGICGPAPEHYHTCTEYYVQNDHFQGWRTEYELTKRAIASPPVESVTQNKAA